MRHFYFGNKVTENLLKLENLYQDFVILPSFSFDKQELCKVEGYVYYEQRLLINLLLLKDPKVHVYYITSVPIDDSIVNYYQQLCQVEKSSFRERLHTFTCFDSSKTSCLSEKFLKKPGLLSRVKNSLRDNVKKCLLVNISTKFEESVAKKLGIPLIGVNPSYSHFGTKSGSNLIFQESKIPFPDSTKLCFKENEFLEEIYELIQRNPDVNFLVLKLNDSFSGKGNALFNLQPLRLGSRRRSIGPISSEVISVSKIKREIKSSRFEGDACWEYFKKRMTDMGIIAQIFIDNMDSPSCQGCMDYDRLHIISTHDQILSGKDHQIYSGCSFPSDLKYQSKIMEYTKSIGENLMQKGVKGCFGVDYLLSKDESKIYAIEINLRMTGTTHPMLTLKYLVEGKFENGDYTSKDGKKKYYVSSDNIIDENYKKLLPIDIIEFFQNSNLSFSKDHQVGVVFHMLGSLSEYGKLGITSIGNTMDQAKDYYQKTIDQIDQFVMEINNLI